MEAEVGVISRLSNTQKSACSNLQGVKQAKISNYLVVAIDKELEEHLTANGHNVYHRDISVS